MIAIAVSLRNATAPAPVPGRRYRLGRTRIMLIGATVAALACLAQPGLLSVALASLADAYLQVSVFVAGTLLLVAWSERATGLDIAAWLSPRSPWRLAAAALLGALPGCGGAVVVVTQYVAGRTTFGAFVAVLTATMGDAAFLLLAREPVTGFAMMLLGLATGILTGAATERLLPDWRSGSALPEAIALEPASPTGPARRSPLEHLWNLLLVPGAVLAVLGALQIQFDTVPWLSGLALAVGVAGALLAVALWVAGDPGEGGAHEAPGPAADTAMVTVWVLAAFLAFDLVTAGLGLDLAALVDGAWMTLPLLGVLVGFLPGCGPQIVVATFYLSGLLPVSAMAANAISNDGDALFPALVVGYGLHIALPLP